MKCFDFEKETVSDEWGVGGKAIESFTGMAKNSQIGNESGILACTEKGIIRVDPRLDGMNKTGHSKFYTSNPLFSKISTTLAGNILIASKDGVLRLYSTDIGKRAKTKLPALIKDDPIGVDTTHNGDWVLATFKGYILVIPTLVAEGKTGFEKQMKNKDKP